MRCFEPYCHTTAEFERLVSSITMQHMNSIKDVRNELKSTIEWSVMPSNHCNAHNVDDSKLTKVDVTAGSVAVKTEFATELSQDVRSSEADVTVLKEECLSPVRDYYQPWDSYSASKTDAKDSIQRRDSKSTLEPKPSMFKSQGSESLDIKYEITLECSVCLEEFSDEDAYNCHMATHDESNQNPHEESLEYPQSSVDPLPTGLVEDKTRQEVSASVTVESIKKEPSHEYIETIVSETDGVLGDSNAECEDSLKNILYQNLRETCTSETHTDETHDDATHTDDTIYTCDTCDYSTTREDNLNIHLEIHSTEKQFTCKICWHEFSRKSGLARHMKTHTGEKPFACKTCDYRCIFKKHLTEHEKVHTGIRPYACQVCGFKFARKSDMVRHERTAHTDDKTVACKLCEYKCKRQCDLVYHMVIHTGERRFRCDLCDFKFARKHDLTSHKATHTGEKPFACNMCPYRCNRKKSLVDHVRTHTKEKPYGCDVCGYQCITQNYLMRHMRTHAGERPFACALCEYKFARKHQLESHMRLVHSSSA